ncbi:helix-turn-helix transcriptional regulator [Arthrobacter sp. B1805]|uniref:helix-turn-helix transcriptional regulator n=2 Tax=Arthrobacter sp. B1805 TaxID=2058892 RepID=UPI000CE2C268|nr:helix-turn-helix transcriptional regulator [Arthrobacter sp. B1805]
MADDSLGAFLRARRNAASAQDYPFASLTTRRVPGLRREEVAELAGLSTDYYIRLEQGREKRPSDQVVSALSEALKLTRHQDDHLRLLAGLAPQPPATAAPIDPALIHMLNTWINSAAFILDPLLNITQLNPLARELFSSFARHDNLARTVFFDPAAKLYWDDWPQSAEMAVAALRATMHQHPSAAERDALISELRTDREFERLWQKFDVRPKMDDTCLLHHERVGEITIRFQAFSVMSAPGHQLVVYTAEPGSVSETRLLSLLTDDKLPEVDDAGTTPFFIHPTARTARQLLEPPESAFRPDQATGPSIVQ